MHLFNYALFLKNKHLHSLLLEFKFCLLFHSSDIFHYIKTRLCVAQTLHFGTLLSKCQQGCLWVIQKRIKEAMILFIHQLGYLPNNCATHNIVSLWRFIDSNVNNNISTGQKQKHIATLQLCYPGRCPSPTPPLAAPAQKYKALVFRVCITQGICLYLSETDPRLSFYIIMRRYHTAAVVLHKEHLVSNFL